MDSIEFAQVFQFLADFSNRKVNQVLVISSSDVGLVLKVFIIANDHMSDLIFDTVIDDISAGLVDIVIYRIISFSGNVCLALGSSFDSLQVFDALQTSIFLIEPLVDGFDTFSIHNESFVDWESVQKLGMNHLDNLIHDAPKKVQEQSTKNSMQRETVQNDVERE